MLIRAEKEITRVDDDDLYLENYMDSLQYISNLYMFLNSIKNVIQLSKVKFIPTFISSTVAEKMGVLTTEAENEMKIFMIQSKVFLGDKVNKILNDRLLNEIYNMSHSGDIITFEMRDIHETTEYNK